MPKLRLPIIILLVVGMLASLALAAPLVSSNAPANPEAVAAAKASALKWLSKMDKKAYGETWDDAAPLFKEAVPRGKWKQMAAAARAPLGTLEAREITSATYATSLPGAPDGEYVVIQTQARFSNKKDAVETITPMKTPDGTWRVSGYYVR